MAGEGLSFIDNLQSYFNLKEVNDELARENAELLNKLYKKNQMLFLPQVEEIADQKIINKFTVITAKVINNSVSKANNFITLDKGRKEGIHSGMGIINPNGVVGIVNDVSDHYAIAYSLLHSGFLVSAKIKRTETIGSAQWGSQDPKKGLLKYIPKHVKPLIGDTVITSGYSSIYPEGIVIGIISKMEDSVEDQFLNIEVDLSVNFNSLSYVYVIENNLKAEIDSLSTKLEINE